MKRGLLLFAAIGVIVAGIYWWRGPKEETPDTDAVIHIAVEGSPVSLDPIEIVETASGALAQALHSPLWRIRSDGSPDYVLAKSAATSQDGLNLIVSIRDDVRFSDGSPIRPQDVVWSIRRFKDSSHPLASVMARLKSIEVLGSDQVELKLHEPDEEFVNALGHISASIISEKSAKQSKQPLNRQLIGAGPWILQTFEPGVNYSFVPNPYFPRRQPFGRLDFNVRTDGQAALRDFRAKTLQIVRLRGPMLGEVADYLGSAPKLRKGYEGAILRSAPASQIETLIVNWDAPIFASLPRDERRAWLRRVELALNESDIVRAGEMRQTGAFPQSVISAFPAVDGAASSWRPVGTLEFIAPSESASRHLAAAAQEALKSHGMEVTLRTLEVPQLISAILKKDFTLAQIGFEMPVSGITPWRIFWTPGPFSGFGEILPHYATYEANCRQGTPGERAAARAELARWHATTQSVWVPEVTRPTTLLCAPGVAQFPIDAAGYPIWDFSKP